jgi:hypothetical protein
MPSIWTLTIIAASISLVLLFAFWNSQMIYGVAINLVLIIVAELQPGWTSSETGSSTRISQAAAAVAFRLGQSCQAGFVSARRWWRNASQITAAMTARTSAKPAIEAQGSAMSPPSKLLKNAPIGVSRGHSTRMLSTSR